MDNLLFEKTINNLYENGRLTFSQLKERIRLTSLFTLEEKKVEDGREVLLSYSVNENKLLVADNKKGIKEGGKKITEYIKTLKENGEQCSAPLNYLEQNINRMNPEDQKDIFGDGQKIYYKVKILFFPEDILNYNTNYLSPSPEGHSQYDETGRPVLSEVAIKLKKFESLINEWQQKTKREKYINESSEIEKIRELHNKEYVNLANNGLNNCLNSVNSHINNDAFKLTDNSNINDYMLSRTYVLLNTMLDNSKHAPYDSLAKMNIAKRLLGVNGISYYDLNNVLNPEQMQYVKDNILNNDSKKEFLNTAIKPIENTLVEFASNILRSTKSLMLLENTVNSKRFSKQIDNSLKFINAGRSIKSLKTELKNLRIIERHLLRPRLSFYHEGIRYSVKEGYSPITELLKLFKPLSENNSKQIITENDLNVIITEHIHKRGNKFCLLSKKTNRNLGCYKSKNGAEKREKQVQYFKNVKNEISAVGGGAVQFGAVKKLEPEQQ